ncbi:MAG TPA: FG-GAP-like repeat-containing protein [Acidobacteriaceae bacterium]
MRPGPAARLLPAVALAVLALVCACRSREALPRPGTPVYLHFVSAFYTGLAALQVGDDVRAETSLREATVLGPGEPAAWVNWGELALRQRSYDAASERLHRALSLAPGNDQIEYLLGLLESERGNSPAAVAALEQAVKSNPRNLRALYQLASEIERQGDPGSEQRFEQLMRQILAAEPGNVAALLELSRVAAKSGDMPALRGAVAAIASHAPGWPAEVQEQLSALQAAVQSPQPRAAATRSIFLRNVLMRDPQFRNSLSDLRPAPGEGAQPMMHFLRAADPPAGAAPPDLGLHFIAHAAAATGAGPWEWAGSIDLNGSDRPVLARANRAQLLLESGASLPFPGSSQPPAPEGVLAVDFNYDFKTDLVLAGQGGVRFYRQEDRAHYTDVTGATRLPRAVLDGSYTGAWALDVEADGDLDILLGVPSGAPLLLRNNGDGTFTVTHPFAGITGVQQFAWADLNGDGNPDAAMIDGAGRLRIYLNQRSGNFTPAAPVPLARVKAIAVEDAGVDGVLSLIAVQAEGNIVRLATKDQGEHWEPQEIARVPAGSLSGEQRVHAEDLDNNGAVDLVLTSVGQPASPRVWLQDEHGAFTPLPQPPAAMRLFDMADLDGDGRLSLIGVDAGGQVAVLAPTLTRNYHWQTIRPRARQATGDQRINSFGIGGEIEIRAGMLVQRQPIHRPQVHFGLGLQQQTDVARILWPNGSVRAEFALKADQQVVTEQRLKGSCPFLFAWDGQRMSFVKDSVPWGSAIGLRINALGAARIAATEEWYKIGREQLQGRDGFYDLRVTGELWESYYYDAMTLMTVDHPSGTEVFTDERFDVPPVKLAITAVAEPQPVARAIDDQGHDVTATLSRLDGVYLDNFGRGQYQGVTRDHFVEVELPSTAPASGPLWLIARGWLHPSDSSINVALAQGSAAKPRWLSLEVPDGAGSWKIAKPNLGFPAGRNKICLIDLAGLFPPGVPRRLRLRTNLEIYWDSIEWAQGAPGAELRIARLAPSFADLHYRGFSVIHQANASSPELPQYDQLAGSSPRWRDLEGFYTRFGDVRELLARADDRYVIMNAGDEMSLRFAAPPPPPVGWVRDFVIAGDGWIKDGDYNSTYSRTVMPYPHHARRDYNTAPGGLEDDWVYQHHPEDWQTYQTRYVSAQPFLAALRPQLARKDKAGQ